MDVLGVVLGVASRSMLWFAPEASILIYFYSSQDVYSEGSQIIVVTIHAMCRL